jgi:hypothetical protein
VGRDVRGRFLGLDLDGGVGRDVDVAVQSTFGTNSLSVGATAVVEGDFQYRSGREADVDAGSTIGGLTTRLPTRPAFSTEIVLRVARILTAMGFVVGGLAVFWLFRSTAPRAHVRARSRPWASLGLGVALLILLPTAGVVLAATLVGIPLALLLLFGWLLLVFFGPMPALAAWGSFLVRGRGGVYGGFVVGSLAMFALLWLWSPAGLLLYLAALLFGIGSWAIAGWEHRSEHEPVTAGTTVAPVEDDAFGEDWEAPLPPQPAAPEHPEPSGDPGRDGD